MLFPPWLDASLTLSLLAIAIVCGIPADIEKRYRRQLVTGVAIAGIIPYLDWRLASTLTVFSTEASVTAWAWACLTVEILGLTEILMNLLQLSRHIDRRPDAERTEAALHKLPMEALPWVDVFIVTYDEPLLVLEKTIVGALSLDYPRLQVCVLDDGNRDWLARFCAEAGAKYIARPTHEHKKPGNQNYALERTSGEFILTLDADFIPYPQFVYRVLGFFQDPTVGVVQTPQCFYNADQLQLNLSLYTSFPDEQRVFFSYLLPCRDAWDACMYVGSCAMIRRSALEESGGFYEGMDIEDIQTGLRLNYHGYQVVYLNERLSVGLLPESLYALLEQRKRWCRGSLQSLWMKEGPLGLRIPFFRRLFFFPIYWLFGFILPLFGVSVPIVLFFTGYGPYDTIPWQEVLFYQASVYCLISFSFIKITHAAAMPVLYTAFLLFQSFKVLPTALSTLIKPFGTPLFKTAPVTPKGNQGDQGSIAWGVLIPCLALLVLTVYGMWITQIPEYTRVPDFDAQITAFVWSVMSLVILGMACLISIERPYRRVEERFEMQLLVRLKWHDTELSGTITDMSLLGCGVYAQHHHMQVGDEIVLCTEPYGEIGAQICRETSHTLGVEFLSITTDQRRRLIIDLFTNPSLKPLRVDADGGKTVLSIVQRLVGLRQ